VFLLERGLFLFMEADLCPGTLWPGTFDQRDLPSWRWQNRSLCVTRISWAALRVRAPESSQTAGDIVGKLLRVGADAAAAARGSFWFDANSMQLVRFGHPPDRHAGWPTRSLVANNATTYS
jgi:hypothetical protein